MNLYLEFMKNIIIANEIFKWLVFVANEIHKFYKF